MNSYYSKAYRCTGVRTDYRNSECCQVHSSPSGPAYATACCDVTHIGRQTDMFFFHCIAWEHENETWAWNIWDKTSRVNCFLSLILLVLLETEFLIGLWDHSYAIVCSVMCVDRFCCALAVMKLPFSLGWMVLCTSTLYCLLVNCDTTLCVVLKASRELPSSDRSRTENCHFATPAACSDRFSRRHCRQRRWSGQEGISQLHKGH